MSAWSEGARGWLTGAARLPGIGWGVPVIIDIVNDIIHYPRDREAAAQGLVLWWGRCRATLCRQARIEKVQRGLQRGSRFKWGRHTQVVAKKRTAPCQQYHLFQDTSSPTR